MIELVLAILYVGFALVMTLLFGLGLWAFSKWVGRLSHEYWPFDLGRISPRQPYLPGVALGFPVKDAKTRLAVRQTTRLADDLDAAAPVVGEDSGSLKVRTKEVIVSKFCAYCGRGIEEVSSITGLHQCNRCGAPWQPGLSER